MINFQFEGIGTLWNIEIFDDIEENEKLKSEISSIIKNFEEDYTRFTDTSFIGKLNQSKSLEDFPAELYDIITYSEKISFASHGFFDISFGKVLEEIGYDKELTFKPRPNINFKPKGIKTLSKSRIEIFEDTSLDLGGIGKGWLIDKITDYFKKNNLKYFIINGGGDIFATTNKNNSFECTLENPFDIQESIGSISIENESIACSSPNRRSWIDSTSGKKYSHLILKDGGLTNEKKVAVFTQAKTATLADVLSTAIFVSPIEVVENIYKQFEVEFMIVFEDNTYFKTEKYKGELFKK